MRATLLQSVACLLFVISTVAYPQQIDPNQIQNNDQLFYALVTAAARDPSSTKLLLSKHKSLVNVELWKRIIETAEYSPGSTAICTLALQVANELPDKRLTAVTLYKKGWYEFGQGNIQSAIENYQQSRFAFEEVGSRRDLIYIFADLGTLYIYSSDYKKAKEYSEQSLAVAREFKSGSGPAAE